MLPRYWATVWQCIKEAESPAASTTESRSRYLGTFYVHCDEKRGPGSLDDAISQGDWRALCELLETFHARLVDDKPFTTASVQCWESTRSFLKDMLDYLSPFSKGLERVSPFLANLPSLDLPMRAGVAGIRALPAATLDDLLDIARPGSSRNPYEDESIQWRNWLIVNLLLRAGLRRAESLLLLTNSLNTESDSTTGEAVHYLNVVTTTELDDRASRPSLKTDASRRQIPVSGNLAHIWNSYLSVRRSGTTNFLLTASGNVGLSKESVDKMFQKMTAAMSDDALSKFRERTGGKKNVSAHDLRHTQATVVYQLWLAGRNDLELVLQRMRQFFGWAKDSEMPQHYASAAIKDDLLRSWSAAFDDTVELLRKHHDYVGCSVH